MTTKLTLSINEETVRNIKRYSKEEGISISKIAEEHFNKIATRNARKKLDITKLKGAFGKDANNLDWKKIKAENLLKKYGK
ncbi:MAG: DUF6364 family protein [Ginsengibacter sp.]